jgi:AAHS family 4-hydroxybenzoate transporter-like MFS transporter
LTQKTFSAAIADAPLRPFQVVVMVLGLALLVIDGIDLQSLSLVTPVILDEWGIDRAAFGPALAASLFGMGFGSLFGGMLGDRLGRLKALFIACLIFGGSTAAAAYTNTVWEMAAVRALGGLGFGAAYPNALALVSDWVNEKWRPHAISLLSIGIPVGISISAAVMPALLPEYGWRGAFLIFAAASVLLAVVVVLVLREPPPFLLARRKREQAQKNAALVIDADIELLPESGRGDEGTPGERIGVFHASNLRLNIAMVVSFSAATTLVYGLLNWTPELLTTAGFTLEQALRASFWQGNLSIVGGLSAGLLARTFGSKAATIGGAAAILATIVALGVMVESLDGAPSAGEVTAIVLLEGLAVGLVSMMITLFYVVMAHGYPASCRSGGIGFILAAGRVFAIAMVFSGGALISMGGEGSFVWYFGVLAAIAVLVFAAAFIVDCHVEPARRKESPA